MGCCVATKINSPSGFEVPDQELVMNEMERQHPFASLQAEDLVQIFGKYLPSGRLSEKEFRSSCSLLHLPTESFFGKSSPYANYLSQLTANSGNIRVKKLLVSGVLLSSSTWENKLRVLFRLYNMSSKIISQVEISIMLEELIHLSVTVLPSMCSLPKNSVDFYTKKLARRSHNLCEKILKSIGNQMLIRPDELINIFRRKEKLQKLFWPNGVRLMLVEEDIKFEYCESASRSTIGSDFLIIDTKEKSPVSRSFRSERTRNSFDFWSSSMISTNRELPASNEISQRRSHQLARQLSQVKDTFN